jgi:hypothetical protein
VRAAQRSEALASRQETSVQNSNPSRNSFSSSLLQELLDRTLFGARPAPGSAPTPGAISHANAAPGDDPADNDTGDVDADIGVPDDAAGRLELAELLAVLRDPIAWVFTLAERHAHGDPIDIAAIHRVHKSVLHRLNSIIGDVPPDDESARIRSADLVTVGSHLIGTLDPSLVQRVMQSVGTRIADVFTAGLQVDPSLYLGRAAAPFPGPDVPPTVPPSWHLGALPARPIAPCGCGASMPRLSVPYGGHYPTPFAGPHALRSVVPPWCWHSFPFAI